MVAYTVLNDVFAGYVAMFAYYLYNSLVVCNNCIYLLNIKKWVMRSVYYSKGSLLDLVWKMESKWFDAVEIDFTNFKKNNYG